MGFYWQMRERDDGKIGTAHHAFPLPHPMRGPWRPLCGEGQHPMHWAVTPAAFSGEPMPKNVAICAECKRRAKARAT